METRGLKIPQTDGQGQKFANNRVVSSRYTLITFIPKNLFEQFRRAVNFYYLCIIIILLSLDVPVNPIPYIASFGFVLGVTAAKRGYEDWECHQADKKVNEKLVRILDPNGNIVKIKACKLRVGQIVKLSEDEPIPCDLLLLASHSTTRINLHQCQITTANLDGESNHKLRICPAILPDFGKLETDIFPTLEKESLKLDYDEPKEDLYNFSGTLTSGKTKQFVELTMDNILLRGTTLKSSGSIYGCIIYAGKETRLSKNTDSSKAVKFSTVEHTMNKIVSLMFVLLLLMAGICTSLYFAYRDSTKIANAWYLPNEESSNASIGILTFFSYLILFCFLIPVSLPVSVELQKFGCSKFFAWDLDITCRTTQTPALCNTSDLNEELGQIEYLFTDKTGTLTENNLNLLFCSIGGVNYKYSGSKLTEVISAKIQGQHQPSSNNDKPIAEFLKALALCHTVQIIPTDSKHEADTTNGIRYYASSLDEATLVKAANSLGMKYVSQTNDMITIEFGNKSEVFKRHLTLQFDADRKCMSVIVEDSHSRIWLISKGAETSLLPKVALENSSLIEPILTQVNEYAEMGLRTLVVAQKEITKHELETILSRTESLRKDPIGLAKYYSEIESNFAILGATGVEDQLQDGVPETLTKLKAAGIRIWMLTGDKLETAVNIGISCGLETSKKNMTILANYKDDVSFANNLRKVGNESQEGGKSLQTLVIDGNSFAIGFEHCKDLLMSIMTRANQVIFCRMTPLQKAQVVQLIKSSKTRVGLTCAVGDGGNDVAMIKEAHIGIGIMGKEGRQAARASDFAVARFKFLQKVILVHGYWHYYRLVNLILYFFYRGVYFVFITFLYGFDCVFSANSVYDPIFIMLFSMVFTSVPIVIYGLSEQPISASKLINNPNYYRDLKGNSYFSWGTVLKWILITIWHILVCYYGSWIFWKYFNTLSDAATFSIFINCLVIAISNLKIFIECRYITWITVVGQTFSFISLVFFYSILFQIGSGSGSKLDFSYYQAMAQPQIWLAFVLIITVAMLPDFCMGPVRNLMQGKLSQKLQEISR